MNHNVPRILATCGVLAGFGLFSDAARATIIFTTSPVATDINILSITELTATTAFGQANSTSDRIIEIMTDTTLTSPSAGQARVEAVSTLFTTVMFTPSTGLLGYEVLEINPQRFTPGGATGTFTLQAMDQFGNTFNSATFALGNGDNRVAAVASGGQVITKLTITANDAIISDIRQIRVGGVTPLAALVPEPATSVMALGAFVLIGGRFLVRRRRLA